MDVTISFIGIIIGIVFFVVLSYKGNNLALSAGISAFVILLFNLPASENGVLADLTGFWVAGAASSMSSYLLIFALGGVYGKLMDASGATRRIAFSLLNTFSKMKNKKFGIVMFLPVMYLIFTYVGVHGFLIVFLMVSLAREMLHDQDLPWRFYCYGAAGILPGYYLAGSISSVNALGATITGGTAASGAAMSIIYCVIYWIVLVFLIRYDIASATKRGEGFMETGAEMWKLEVATTRETDDLPKLWQAVIPMVLMIVVAAMGINVVIALVVGIVLAIVLQWHYLKDKLKTTVSTGAAQTFLALINVCGAAGLGTVIRNVAGYQVITGALDAVAPLLGGVLLTIIGTVILGSSTSSLSAFGSQAFEYFTSAGISTSAAHRLLLFGSNWIYPPHNTGAVNASATAKVPYKAAVMMYMKESVICNTIPLILCVILAGLGVL